MQETKEKEVEIVFREGKRKARFIPNMCPTCPNFKGERTCMLFTEKGDLGYKEWYSYELFYLDMENPYGPKKSTCDILKREARYSVGGNEYEVPEPYKLPNDRRSELLEEAEGIARKYEGKDTLFFTNFMSIAKELIEGDFSFHGATLSHWPYRMEYGKALREWLTIPLPVIEVGKFDEKGNNTNGSMERNTETLENWRMQAHNALMNQ